MQHPEILPATDNPAGTIFGQLPDEHTVKRTVVKINHTFNERHSIQGTYNTDRDFETENPGLPVPFGQLKNQGTQVNSYPINVWTFNYNWTIRPNMLNHANFGEWHQCCGQVVKYDQNYSWGHGEPHPAPRRTQSAAFA